MENHERPLRKYRDVSHGDSNGFTFLEISVKNVITIRVSEILSESEK